MGKYFFIVSGSGLNAEIIEIGVFGYYAAWFFSFLFIALGIYLFIYGLITRQNAEKTFDTKKCPMKIP